MGDRSQVAIKAPTKADPEAKIYLYSHWGGDGVYTQLQDVLRKGRCLDDSEYFTRLLAREMGFGGEGETGFGIGNSAHGDIEHAIPVLDFEKQEIAFEDPEWEHNKNPKAKALRLTFTQFAEHEDIVGLIEGE